MVDPKTAMSYHGGRGLQPRPMGRIELWSGVARPEFYIRVDDLAQYGVILHSPAVHDARIAVHGGIGTGGHVEQLWSAKPPRFSVRSCATTTARAVPQSAAHRS